MWKYKFLFDVKSFLQKSQVYLCILPPIWTFPQSLVHLHPPPPPHSPLSPTLHCKHHALPSPGEQTMVNHRLCTLKYHVHMKIMLQTPQVSPYLFLSPHPSRFSSLLNLGHHFSFWNRNKVILGPIWNKNNLFTFSQSGKFNLKKFT